MINALFDKDEIALIDQFANVSALATGVYAVPQRAQIRCLIFLVG